MKSVGCLILHGFAGDIHEVLPLALSLREQGYVVECPTLDGHGAGKRHLGRSTRHQWVRSAEEAYKRLSMRVDEIVVIGFSMGGLLAAQVASRFPVRFLTTINTPYYYWDIKQAFQNVSTDFRRHSARYLHAMVRIPLRSMLQFRRLLAETKPLLPLIDCPCLILQGQRDDTVQAVSAGHLRANLGSDRIEVAYFPEADHLLLKGPDADDAIRLISKSIRTVLAGHPE